MSKAALPRARRAQLLAGEMLKLRGTVGDVVELGLSLASEPACFLTAEVTPCDAGDRLRGWRE